MTALEKRNQKTPGQSSGRGRLAYKWVRIFLAGPVVLIVSLLVVLGMPLWLPPGPGRVDNLVMPVAGLPLVWAILFFYALLDRKLWRVSLVAIALASLNLILLYQKFA
jgi:hypothetical protein